MRTLYFINSCVFFLVSCISVRPPSDIRPATIAQKPVIILVPGYYGTAIANAKTGERLHLTVGKAIFGGPPLALNFEELAIPGAVKTRTDGVLDSCSVIPGLYSIDIHGALLDYLGEQCPSSKVITFAYDWRESDAVSARLLSDFVARIRNAGAKKIAIIGFSNGGTVTSYFLRYGGQSAKDAKETWEGAQMIDDLVLIGAPFRGTMQSFYNMHHGVAFGPAKDPLNAVVMSTFPSLYELLPTASEKNYLSKDRKPMKEPIYTASLWLRRQWGLFRPDQKLPPSILRKRERYLEEKLNAGLAFSQRLLDDTSRPLDRKIPALVVLGKGQATLAKARWSATSLQEEGAWTFREDGNTADGDGTILYTSAIPPKAFHNALRLQQVDVKTIHAKMVSDPNVLEQVKGFLKGEGF